MKHLLLPEGVAALTAQIRRRPLLAFDFDGTLAPIVARPDDAKVPMPIARRLKLLAERLNVAVISGRRVADVRTRLHFNPTYIVGNHGAEDPGLPPRQGATSAMDGFRVRLHAVRDMLDRAGVVIEDKGASVALHYRLARDRQAASALIAEVLASLDPDLRSFGGKFVVNVVERASNDKAQALEVLVDRCKADCALFVGDDINDEPVFARHDPSWLTVRVGRDDVQSQAQYFIDSVSEMPTMLEIMQAALMPRI